MSGSWPLSFSVGRRTSDLTLFVSAGRAAWDFSFGEITRFSAGVSTGGEVCCRMEAGVAGSVLPGRPAARAGWGLVSCRDPGSTTGGVMGFFASTVLSRFLSSPAGGVAIGEVAGFASTVGFTVGWGSRRGMATGPGFFGVSTLVGRGVVLLPISVSGFTSWRAGLLVSSRGGVGRAG